MLLFINVLFSFLYHVVVGCTAETNLGKNIIHNLLFVGPHCEPFRTKVANNTLYVEESLYGKVCLNSIMCVCVWLPQLVVEGIILNGCIGDSRPKYK